MTMMMRERKNILELAREKGRGRRSTFRVQKRDIPRSKRATALKLFSCIVWLMLLLFCCCGACCCEPEVQASCYFFNEQKLRKELPFYRSFFNCVSLSCSLFRVDKSWCEFQLPYSFTRAPAFLPSLIDRLSGYSDARFTENFFLPFIYFLFTFY